jgi:hypothetical protein
MATEAPAIDVFSPMIQELLDAYERDAFPEGLGEDRDDLGPLYNAEFKRPYVCTLISDVMSGRWGLGDSQMELSEQVGITRDRSWVSRAIHQGKLSFDVFLRLRYYPHRPTDWEPDVDRLRPDSERSAFIGVARRLAEQIVSRPSLSPQRMNELNYELTCEVFKRFGWWLAAYSEGNRRAAAELVRAVCGDVRRNVIPAWYTTRQQRATQREIRRLQESPEAAFNHLVWLQRNWLDVFVATYYGLESIKWTPPRT